MIINTTNYSPFILGSLCFSGSSVYKVWLHYITFLRKHKQAIWAFWRTGNLTLNSKFWSIKGEGEKAIQEGKKFENWIIKGEC